MSAGEPMSKERFLALLTEAMNLAPGSLRGDERLAGLPAWDSLAQVNFLAAADEECGCSLEPDAIGRAATVAELAALLGDAVTF